jgi:hypothetical protein
MSMVTPLAALLLAGTSAFVTYGFGQDNVNPQTAVLQDFEKRITDYVRMQKNLAKGISATKPTTEPQLILERQKELARKIREARSGAQQGAIFSPEISKEFHRLLAIAMQGPNNADIKKSLARSEPVRLPLHVNEAYPANIPLQSTPPTILMNLPRLPAELEYRIAGHALVLRDAVANLVVDLMPDAIS